MPWPRLPTACISNDSCSAKTLNGSCRQQRRAQLGIKPPLPERSYSRDGRGRAKMSPRPPAPPTDLNSEKTRAESRLVARHLFSAFCQGYLGNPQLLGLAERVGFVPVVASPLNNLGPISIAQTSRNAQNLSIRYKTGTARAWRPHLPMGSRRTRCRPSSTTMMAPDCSSALDCFSTA